MNRKNDEMIKNKDPKIYNKEYKDLSLNEELIDKYLKLGTSDDIELDDEMKDFYQYFTGNMLNTNLESNSKNPHNEAEEQTPEEK